MPSEKRGPIVLGRVHYRIDETTQNIRLCGKMLDFYKLHKKCPSGGTLGTLQFVPDPKPKRSSR
jgi:hypothetical protein